MTLLTQLASLLLIGVAWSACLFVAVDACRDVFGSPTSVWGHRVWRLIPLVVSSVVTVWAFPVAAGWVDFDVGEHNAGLTMICAVLGMAGWGGAAGAHHLAGEWIRAGHETLIGRIRGIDPGSAGGGEGGP